MKILLTAPPATGKSTVFDAFLGLYQGKAIGVLSREILDCNGTRIGFAAVTSAGQSQQFMGLTSEIGSFTIAGMFDVDIRAIDSWVVPFLKQSCLEPQALVYLDEIGRAQALSISFIETVRSIINSDNSLLASIVYEDEPWSLEFKSRSDICLLEVSIENRNQMPEILSKAFSQDLVFRQLTAKQQQLVYVMLKRFIALGYFNSAKKLFTNAIGYVVDNKLEQVSNVSEAVQRYVVAGQSRSHEISYTPNTNKFSCDCDLANGRGDFFAAPEICSHYMSIQLLLCQ